jgi:hypothetical protein
MGEEKNAYKFWVENMKRTENCVTQAQIEGYFIYLLMVYLTMPSAAQMVGLLENKELEWMWPWPNLR